MNYRSFLKSEWLTLVRRKQDTINALLFFVMVILLFPLGVDPSKAFLEPASGGIVWCAVALSILMAVESMYKEDFNDGSLEQWLTSGLSLPYLVFLKVFVQWLVVIVPLLLVLPLLANMLFFPIEQLMVMISTLLLGTPALFFIGAIGSALTVSLRRGAVLMLLLILPLYIPVIIFATGAIRAAQSGMSYSGQLAILAAISLTALVLSPLMAALSIKASMN
ncbi:heme exporter protein CcmB [Marinomonas piezotolerans]|uniref:Heme exporter protein B n=1 Tax=Marinomonas piezotolerans TaxID=2213058 RepID=A0A370U780_9GAMM|nr:heme exporter protein CcmB [Marinomonas piezotolerans]RDL43628.1 heme exporter protein CcmB [Marinomonas piezotolerans]